MKHSNGTKAQGRMWVTPEMAKQWLETNTRNRSLRWHYVLGLARSMKRGEWVFVGDSIQFDVDGILTNGQHRLAACVESGVTIELNIVRGVPREAYQASDRVLVRQHSDTLHVQGMTNCAVRGSIVSFAYGYEISSPCGKLATKSHKPTIQQLENYRKMHPTVDAFVETRWMHPSRTRIRTSCAGLLWFAFERSGFQDRADDFFSVMCGETESTRYHPARMLTERFLQAKVTRHSLRQNEAVTFCIRAFNSFVEGKLSLQKLYGDVSEVSPSFNGWPRGMCQEEPV